MACRLNADDSCSRYQTHSDNGVPFCIALFLDRTATTRMRLEGTLDVGLFSGTFVNECVWVSVCAGATAFGTGDE